MCRALARCCPLPPPPLSVPVGSGLYRPPSASVPARDSCNPGLNDRRYIQPQAQSLCHGSERPLTGTTATNISSMPPEGCTDGNVAESSTSARKRWEAGMNVGLDEVILDETRLDKVGQPDHHCRNTLLLLYRSCIGEGNRDYAATSRSTS